VYRRARKIRKLSIDRAEINTGAHLSTKDDLIDEIGKLLQNDSELTGSDWRQMVWVFHVRSGSSNCNGFIYQKDGEAVPRQIRDGLATR
jgi:hypothetical protein